MKIGLYLAFSLMLTACGYHLVGQGGSAVIPDGVQTAQIEHVSGAQGLALSVSLQQLWSAQNALPMLQDAAPAQSHITLRIEQVQLGFSPIAFDASGLAIQYRLQLAAVLNMYQHHTLIWGTGVFSVQAEVFAADNPSAIEAERATLLLSLRQTWAQQAMNRLQSGF